MRRAPPAGDDLGRRRLAGIEMLSYSVGPLGGQVRAGWVADVWSVRGAVADEHAVAEREARAARAGD